MSEKKFRTKLCHAVKRDFEQFLPSGIRGQQNRSCFFLAVEKQESTALNSRSKSVNQDSKYSCLTGAGRPVAISETDH